MSAKHTLGPWNCNRASSGGHEIICSEVAPLDVCVLSHSNKSRGEIDANARLIAAAPELLEAAKPVLRILEAVKHTVELTGNQLERMESLRAAIAKIEG